MRAPHSRSTHHPTRGPATPGTTFKHAPAPATLPPPAQPPPLPSDSHHPSLATLSPTSSLTAVPLDPGPSLPPNTSNRFSLQRVQNKSREPAWSRRLHVLPTSPHEVVATPKGPVKDSPPAAHMPRPSHLHPGLPPGSTPCLGPMSPRSNAGLRSTIPMRTSEKKRVFSEGN